MTTRTGKFGWDTCNKCQIYTPSKILDSDWSLTCPWLEVPDFEGSVIASADDSGWVCHKSSRIDLSTVTSERVLENKNKNGFITNWSELYNAVIAPVWTGNKCYVWPMGRHEGEIKDFSHTHRLIWLRVAPPEGRGSPPRDLTDISDLSNGQKKEEGSGER